MHGTTRINLVKGKRRVPGGAIDDVDEPDQNRSSETAPRYMASDRHQGETASCSKPPLTVVQRVRGLLTHHHVKDPFISQHAVDGGAPLEESSRDP